MNESKVTKIKGEITDVFVIAGGKLIEIFVKDSDDIIKFDYEKHNFQPCEIEVKL